MPLDVVTGETTVVALENGPGDEDTAPPEGIPVEAKNVDVTTGAMTVVGVVVFTKGAELNTPVLKGTVPVKMPDGRETPVPFNCRAAK